MIKRKPPVAPKVHLRPRTLQFAADETLNSKSVCGSAPGSRAQRRGVSFSEYVAAGGRNKKQTQEGVFPRRKLRRRLDELLGCDPRGNRILHRLLRNKLVFTSSSRTDKENRPGTSNCVRAPVAKAENIL